MGRQLQINDDKKEKAMSENPHLEHVFLKQLAEQHISVSIFLKSGIKLHGMILDADMHVVFLKDAITQMIYKHAISTVVPSRDPHVS